MSIRNIVFGTLLSLTACVSWACPDHELGARWADAKYQLTGVAQERAFESLLSDISSARDRTNLSKTELNLWEGTTLSTYASIVGGTKALSMVKKARNLLESSIKEDPTLEEGLALGVLGTLYHKVPAWPLAYKDDKRAKEYLKEALARFPEGMHANMYYGQYLLEKKAYGSAEGYLTAALDSAANRNDAISQGRQTEILATLEQISAS